MAVWLCNCVVGLFSAEEMKAAAKGLRRQGEQFSEDLECHVDQGLCGKDEATSAVHLIGRLLHAKRTSETCTGGGLFPVNNPSPTPPPPTHTPSGPTAF